MVRAENVERRRGLGGLLAHKLALDALLEREASRTVRLPVLFGLEREQLSGGIV